MWRSAPSRGPDGTRWRQSAAGAQVPVDESGGDSSERRCDQVDPQVREVPADEGWPDGSGRVHRGAADRPTDQGPEGDGTSDRDRCCLTDGPRVSGDRDDHEHEEEREDGLPDECLRVATRRLGDTEGHVTEADPQDQAAAIAPATCAVQYGRTRLAGK